MEKMVNLRLVWFLERWDLLSPTQCGFRKNRSTTDCLVQLDTAICQAFASNQHFVCVFFDLEKAYDTAWRRGILRQLHDFGLRGELPVFIDGFLRNRHFRVRVGTHYSNTFQQVEGVPQGSVLSVTLFAIAINGIASTLPAGVINTLYVDDFSIGFGSTQMRSAQRRLQLALDHVSRWAEERGFRFSTTKTVAVHFCRKRGFHPDPDLYPKALAFQCALRRAFWG